MEGTIKSVDGKKGYGFIISNNKSYFFHKSEFHGHWNDLVDDYEKGLTIEVEFEPEMGEKGPRATEVGRVDFPNSRR